MTPLRSPGIIPLRNFASPLRTLRLTLVLHLIKFELTYTASPYLNAEYAKYTQSFAEEEWDRFWEAARINRIAAKRH